MADDKKKSGGESPKTDGEVLAEIVGIIFVLMIASALFASFQNRFADGGKIDIGAWAWRKLSVFSNTVDAHTPVGALVRTKNNTDVWSSALRERILGVQEKGAIGFLLAQRMEGDDLFWHVDFDNAPDGWVFADMLARARTDFVARIRSVLWWLSGILSVLGGAVGVYSFIRWKKITKLHRMQMRLLEKKLTQTDIAGTNVRWDRVEALVASDNPGDWRVAIIEADIMLDDLVTNMGYGGDTLGEKLKRIEKSDFTTLESAWEAHKIRNRIAHSGSDFILTAREAKRVIGLFRDVFREFDYV